jgi:hypothetical protein
MWFCYLEYLTSKIIFKCVHSSIGIMKLASCHQFRQEQLGTFSTLEKVVTFIKYVRV